METVGDWRSLDFRGYADTAKDVESEMAKLLIETEDLSGDEVLSPGTRGTEG